MADVIGDEGVSTMSGRVAPSDRTSVNFMASKSLVSIQHHDEAAEATDVGAGNTILDPETKWILSNIRMRKCKRFVAQPPKNDNAEGGSKSKRLSKRRKSQREFKEYCECGYAKSKHGKKAVERGVGNTDKWKAEADTEPDTTDAFGEIEFPGYGDNVSKYVRVDHKTKMNTMKTLLVNRWGLNMPNLLISVTGGAKNFHMKARLKDEFRRGLMKAALSTGAWIVTGGTNAGVMKHVGEAVRDCSSMTAEEGRVICIGIAPWGCVQDKERLISPEGKWPAEHRVEVTPKKKQSFLDPNHTHFILVDNGTQYKFGTEIDFRGEVEAMINDQKTSTGSGVPVVQLVLEGGPGTLKTVRTAINNGTPVVIIKGSGRAADILAFAYQNTKEVEIESTDKDGNPQIVKQIKIEDHVSAEITSMIEKEFGPNDIETHVSYVRDCTERKNLMTVFEIDSRNSTRDVDMAILKSLLKANSEEVMDQLKLALAWNRIDVAKSEIFTDSRDWKLDDMMMMAIQLNRVDFVELFLDNGVSLKDFLTVRRLLTLYNSIPKNSLLYTLLTKVHGQKSKKNTNKLSLQDVGILLQDLMGDYYQPYYLTNPDYTQINADSLLAESSTDGERHLELHRPIQELFIWSVLMNRQGLAILFWKEGNEQTAAALVANSVLKGLRKCTEDAEHMSKLQQNADEFESLAVGVLNSCYNSDERKAQDLLIRELDNWGKATSVLIAVQADNKRFVSQTACQSLLNTIWMGKMSLENGIFKLMFSIFCFPLVWLIIRFRDEEKAKFDALITTQTEKTGGPGTLVREQTALMKRQSTKIDLNSQDEDEQHQQTGTYRINPCKKLMLFFTAPVIIFSLNVMSYLLFLGIYSYILLIELKPEFSPWEGLLIGWVFTIMVEEFRQLVTNNSTSFMSKLYSYFTDSWNMLDMITILLFILGMVLRFIPSTFTAGRVFLSLNLISFFLRILHIFSVNKQLGPKLVMIRRMIEDLMSFVIILMVFIVAYAIASEAILYPNQQLSAQLLYDIPRKAYWTIYGELFLEDIEGENPCTNDPALYLNGTEDRCPSEVGKYLVPILMGVYILLTNVLLLNLLIAMFSYTFQQIQDNTEQYWNFQRFQLIIEYHSRPPLPPPLIVLAHFYFLCKYLLPCCNDGTMSKDLRKKYESKLEEKQLVQWENVIADTYLRKTEEGEKEKIEHRVKATLLRLDALSSKVEDIQDSQLAMGSMVLARTETDMGDSVAVPPKYVPTSPQLDHRLQQLEGQMVNIHKALNWIMTSMAKGQSASTGPIPLLPDPEVDIRKRAKAKAEEEQRDRQLATSLRVYKYKNHYESRLSPYPGTRISRYPVPDDKVSWEEAFPNYDPVVFTSDLIHGQSWADIDLLKTPVNKRNVIVFNEYDKKNQVDRTSHMGKYKIVDGLPVNPRGRTGIKGRGSLGRWGPNHAGDPVVTRWKVDELGNKQYCNNKPVLEFVVVQRSDNKLWALPGAICEPGEKVWDILRTDFTEEALGSLLHDEEAKAEIEAKILKLSELGVEVYMNYADDSRNTDNAWLETRVVNYHDETGNILRHFDLRAGDTVEAAIWQTMASSLSLHGSHSYFCQLVAEKHGAYF